jgi:ABC-2 type transport system ATP-binding protein
MIEVEGLTKRFGYITAVDNITFKVDKGEVVGFLGPNGAGKSTTMRILTCFLPADQGRCRIAGFDVLTDSMEVRKRIGYLPENTPLYEEMSVEGFLKYIAEVRGIKKDEQKSRIDKMIEICGIEPVLKMDISELSKGYRQRVGLAQAMIHDPEILILDEPTSGLDPNQIIEIRELIKRLGKEKTVILSTHILSEAEATCSRMVIIDRGKLIADGSLSEVSRMASGTNTHRLKARGDRNVIERELQALPGATGFKLVSEEGGFLSYEVYGEANRELGEEIFRSAVRAGFSLAELVRERRTLEDIFIQLTRGEQQ